MLTLTVKEIVDLANFAGLSVTAPTDADELETEISVMACPPEGVKNEGEESDPDSVSHYKHIAYVTEYPEEGCCGLGDERAP